MEEVLKIDVADLDEVRRRAIENVIGCELADNQRLIIRVIGLAMGEEGLRRPSQSLEEWAKVYEGLSEEEVIAIDRIATTRADLSRSFS